MDRYEFTPAVALRSARKKEKLTQKQLARKLKMRDSRVVEMEHGKRGIDVNLAKRLGEILRIYYGVFL